MDEAHDAVSAIPSASRAEARNEDISRYDSARHELVRAVVNDQVHVDARSGDGYALQVRAYADAGSSPLKIDNVRIGVVP